MPPFPEHTDQHRRRSLRMRKKRAACGGIVLGVVLRAGDRHHYPPASRWPQGWNSLHYEPPFSPPHPHHTRRLILDST